MFQQQQMEAVGVTTTQVGAGTAVGSWLLSNEFGILAGIVIGVFGALMQRHYHRKRDQREQAEYEERSRREQAEHEARMRVLKGE